MRCAFIGPAQIRHVRREATKHAEEMNGYLTENLGRTPFEYDKLWSAVKKKQK